MTKYMVETCYGPGRVDTFFDKDGEETTCPVLAVMCVIDVDDQHTVVCNVSDIKLETVH